MRTREKTGSTKVELGRARIVVRGVVQGVGFRPFIYRLTSEYGLKGWVLNSTEGAIIENQRYPLRPAENDHGIVQDVPRLPSRI